MLYVWIVGVCDTVALLPDSVSGLQEGGRKKNHTAHWSRSADIGQRAKQSILVFNLRKTGHLLHLSIVVYSQVYIKPCLPIYALQRQYNLSLNP